jgi:hypothetical protein
MRRKFWQDHMGDEVVKGFNINMESHLTYYEFRQQLTPEKIRPIQIIQLGMGLGIVVFGALVLLLYYSIPAPRANDITDSLFLLQILTYTHILFAIVSYAVTQVVFKKMLSRNRLSKLSYETRNKTIQAGITPLDKCFFKIQGAIIVRLAMFEGVAFFGLVICLLGAIQGVLQLHTGYWVNAFSTVVALGLILKTYPTRERIEEICKNANLLTS